jgi:hypothetical protein
LKLNLQKNTKSRSFVNFARKNKSKFSCRVSTKNIGYDEELNIIYIPFYLFEFWLNNEKDILLI